ncbi:MAG TPA: glycosyltransferase family 4 protein [Anaeromyxobacteraceae bacterium]|nr:glycosyltransferase family 4 protein [Anaeromyxobacteraceae bacterium]
MRQPLLRVALVGDWPPPYGGISIHVQGLEAALREGGVEVRVLDIMPGAHRAPGVVPARGEVPYARELARIAARSFLVHVHTTGSNLKSWVVALAGSRARRVGAPQGVLTLHSGLAARWLSAKRSRRELARAACTGYGQIIAVNAEIASALGDCGVPPEKVLVLPAFSPKLLASRSTPPLLEAFRRSHSPLFCAQLSPGPIYGADLLEEAWDLVRARERGAGLVVFGTASVTGPLGRRGITAGVLALGEIPHPQVLGTMEACDAFVRPTRSDGDAVSVREALALGRTVVASAAGHRPPGCLLFPPGEAGLLAAQMLAAARLPQGVPVPLPTRDPFDVIWQVYASLSDHRGPVSRSVGTGAAHPSSPP